MMGNTKHSQGHWKIKWHEGTNTATVNCISENHSQYRVCSIASNECDAANASLISAAPELLEACAKAFLLIEAKISDNLGLRVDSGTVFNKSQVLTLLEKAIQKAAK